LQVGLEEAKAKAVAEVAAQEDLLLLLLNQFRQRQQSQSAEVEQVIQTRMEQTAQILNLEHLQLP
jgi:hypothetical protein